MTKMCVLFVLKGELIVLVCNTVFMNIDFFFINKVIALC